MSSRPGSFLSPLSVFAATKLTILLFIFCHSCWSHFFSFRLLRSHFSALDFDFGGGSADVMGGGSGEHGNSVAIASSAGVGGGQRVFPRTRSNGDGRNSNTNSKNGSSSSSSSSSSSFPKIVWGSSGSSLSAYDPVTMDLLWSKEIESIVTTMYGVDDSNSWVPLTFLTEEEVNESNGERGGGSDRNRDDNDNDNDNDIDDDGDDVNGKSPSSTSLVPFDNVHTGLIQYQAQGLQALLGASRLGRVLTEGGSTLFITPVKDTAISSPPV